MFNNNFRLTSTSLITAFSVGNLIAGTTLSSPGIAGALGSYRPPTNSTPVTQRRSNGGGARGCGQDSLPPDSVDLLVLGEAVAHRTVSPEPSFFFSVNQLPSSPLRFTLVEPGVPEPLVEHYLTVDQLGIWRIDMPSNVELAQGKTYFWNLVISCEGDQTDQVIRAGVERVAPPSTLPQALSQADEPGEIAAAYAQSGIWYDALATAHQSEVESDYFSQLLKMVGFGQVETDSVNQATLRP